MKQIKIEKSLEIKTEPQAVFDLLTDPPRLSQALAGIFEASLMSELPLVKGSRFNYKYHLGDMTIAGIWTVENIKAPSLYIGSSEGLGNSTWTHTISATSEGSLLDITFEYNIPDGILSEEQEKRLIARNEENMGLIAERLQTALEK